MAIKKKSDLIDPMAPVPRTEAVLMIAKAEERMSKQQQPMIVFELQVLRPDTVETPGGTKAQLGGRELKHYLSFSPKAEGGSIRAYEQLSGEVVPEEYDDEDIKAKLVAMVGSVFNAVVFSEPFYETDANYNPIPGPDGKPILKGYSIRMGDIKSSIRPLSEAAQ